MDYNNNEDQFIAWLCGEKVKFPFFRNMPEVPMPIIEKKEIVKIKMAINNFSDTVVEYSNAVKELCNKLSAYDKHCEIEENRATGN